MWIEMIKGVAETQPMGDTGHCWEWVVPTLLVKF